MSIINLLPEDYRRLQSRRRANVLCLALFAVVMTGVVAAAYVSQDSARQMRRVNEDVTQAYRKAGESITEVQQLEARKKQVIEKARMAHELLERVPRSYLLGTLTNALPEGTSLDKISLKTTQKKTAAKATKAKTKFRSSRRNSAKKTAKVKRAPLMVSLEVTGLARTDEQVAAFIGAVRDCPLVRSVELIFSEEEQIEQTVMRQFQITMELVPNAEVEIDAVDDSPVLSSAVEVDRRPSR